MEFTELQANKIAQSLMSAFASTSTEKPGDGVSREEKVKMLKAIASVDAEGIAARAAYCKSRAMVILPLIPYQSTVRSIFTPEVLEPGAQAYYPISFDYTEVATYLPRLGGNVARLLEGDELYIPTFNIEASVRYNMDIAEQ